MLSLVDYFRKKEKNINKNEKYLSIDIIRYLKSRQTSSRDILPPTVMREGSPSDVAVNELPLERKINKKKEKKRINK